MKPITNSQWAIAQKIIEFVQAQGWDITALGIERYDAGQLFGRSTEGEEWKGKDLKWSLSLSVAPRDDEEMVAKQVLDGLIQ